MMRIFFIQEKKNSILEASGLFLFSEQEHINIEHYKNTLNFFALYFLLGMLVLVKKLNTTPSF